LAILQGDKFVDRALVLIKVRGVRSVL